MKAGWFDIPGEQKGDRTLDEQMLGLEPALAACTGKSVLDLGCAEGLITRQFLHRGAAAAIGVDSNVFFIATARLFQIDPQRERYLYQDLNEVNDEFRQAFEADIVLALALVHKLRDPARALNLFAAMARERMVIRLAAGSTGVIRHKHGRAECDSRRVMSAHGFRLEHELAGPRGELVHHWVRE